MIKADSLCLSLGGRPVLKDISFTLEDTDNLIILGRSGSGKTVLIKTLMGLHVPDSGTVTVDGRDVYAARNLSNAELKHEFAMVFQNAALLDSFTVFQNVALPLFERGEKDYARALDRATRCLAIVGLEDTLDKFPSELSGGMKKRVGIARALVYEPRYIIFDEPVSGLDPITAKEVLYYITQIIRSARATTITITHDIRNLEEIGNMVLFLEAGNCLYYGPVAELHSHKDSFIQGFLGATQ
ncbi:MAG: ATP-binding cassette domain-containing protein [Candidatus Cloacimonadota bacterium]|jgi:phospholipid/cholesterol/gamma-HCH transport system ATP-binding protein|nr:ATP-binding cassette domain-containing protein [Candidatus Cloacimonadota bacterium]NMD12745.1 ATP-binding cassette domain-containing protein [Candidatus Cloacimonadota bacterium]